MNLNSKIIFILSLIISIGSHAQERQDWKGKFEQLGTTLPTPNEYRTGAGAPGQQYWQQRADYKINVSINDDTQVLIGSETITYTNNSPDDLTYLWVQLDQNVRADGNLKSITSTQIVMDSLTAKDVATGLDISDYKGGYTITSVTGIDKKRLQYTINRTMMRIDLDTPLKANGSKFTFNIQWSYNIYDRMSIGGRGGYEYFPKDGNYAYTCAQWFPRMAVYDDINGWQNKQFIGRGEFALPFGNYEVNITVPSDHIVAATGELQNPEKVLTKTQASRLNQARKSYDKPVFIVTEKEAVANEKSRSKKTSTWQFKADNVRDFAFASSRKYIWDAQGVKLKNSSPLAMSFYPKEGNPLWERESTKAVKNTLEVYSDRTIEYPYPVAISVHAANQGMEYPMICFNYGRPDSKGRGRYSDYTLDGMVSVIIHEVGHNFFPMIINSDERQWTWMDEGLNTFLERETKRLHYPDLDLEWGSPAGMTRYMRSDKKYIRPIMTNSEQVLQFGNNAYGKPAAALSLLRETVMGPELFDAAFKEYARRWAFKHPSPADFFRTMEDASAVDLDWFWKGWFYSVDNVDVAVDEVKWFRLRDNSQDPEKKKKKVQQGDLNTQKSKEKASDFSKGYEEITISDTPDMYYGEFQNRIDDEKIKQGLRGKNLYEITFINKGGLVTPLIVEFKFKDGSTQVERIPAEVWRYNENKVTKVFVLDKEVTNVVLDPKLETADTNVADNVFPKVDMKSRFDQFKGE